MIAHVYITTRPTEKPVIFSPRTPLCIPRARSIASVLLFFQIKGAFHNILLLIGSRFGSRPLRELPHCVVSFETWVSVLRHTCS